jgi:hypothetical protein
MGETESWSFHKAEPRVDFSSLRSRPMQGRLQCSKCRLVEQGVQLGLNDGALGGKINAFLVTWKDDLGLMIGKGGCESWEGQGKDGTSMRL